MEIINKQFKNINANFNSNITIRYMNIIKISIIIMIFTIIKPINTNNSTTCYEMYNNSTITENCFNKTACCFLEYSLANKTFTKCLKKINNDENICKDQSDIFVRENILMINCDCNSTYINISIFLLIIIIKLLLL